MKEDQYLDSGVWDWVLGLGFSFGLIRKVFEIVVVCCSGLISAISVGGGDFRCKLEVFAVFRVLGFWGFRVTLCCNKTVRSRKKKE